MTFGRWGLLDGGGERRRPIETLKGDPLAGGFDSLLAEPKRAELFPFVRSVIVPHDGDGFNHELWRRYRVYVYAAIRVAVDQVIGEFVLHADPEAASRRMGRRSRDSERAIRVANKGTVAKRLAEICRATLGDVPENVTRAKCIVAWLDNALCEVRWRELIRYFHQNHGDRAVAAWVSGGRALDLGGMPPVWHATGLGP
ncbi:MAG: hypothetical protein HXY28_10790 [Hydrogenophilaceae bacterium]|jgi:hypothetical protein|nr:hypothetical protein [Hydrogenophilaceae bacterium]